MIKRQRIVEGDLDLSKDDVIWDTNTEIIKGDCILTNLPKGVYPLPKLKQVLGDLDLRASGVLFLPKLKQVKGNVYIDKNSQLLDFGGLQDIGGEVLIYNNKRLDKIFSNSFKKTENGYVRSDIQEENIDIHNL